MKFFSLCLFLFPFYISCSSSDPSVGEPDQNRAFQRLVDLDYDLVARNTANPYDDVGQVHHELLLTYYYADNQPFTFTGIVTTLSLMANTNSSFTDLNKQVPYVFTTIAENRVLDILTRQESCLTEVIYSSVQTQIAQDSLEDFVHNFFTLCQTEEDYNVIYNYIVAYEGTVLKESTWSVDDKRVVLITTSVARHSAYARKKKPKKNKDPDWEYLVGNIIATIDGAGTGEAEAIMRGLVAGVVENKSL